VDDRSAVKRLKRGEVQGLEWLVSRYQVEAARVAFLITQDAHLADDIMQDAFLQFYRRIAQYDERRPFAPYFIRIVVNLAIQTARQQQRLVPLDIEVEEATPESEAEAAELRKIIGVALKALSAEQRAVIVMRYYLEFSEREMAEHLNCPPGTISWRLHAARKRLRGLLYQYVNDQQGEGKGGR
jgi:RNA polymerase sigma-70 factor, ECF subfamily